MSLFYRTRYLLINARLDIQTIYCICSISRVSPPTADCSAAQAAAVSSGGVQPSTSRICLTILYCTVQCCAICVPCTVHSHHF